MNALQSLPPDPLKDLLSGEGTKVGDVFGLQIWLLPRLIKRDSISN